MRFAKSSLLCLLLCSCVPALDHEGRRCEDCPSGMRCVDGECVPAPDDGGVDVRAADADSLDVLVPDATDAGPTCEFPGATPLLTDPSPTLASNNANQFCAVVDGRLFCWGGSDGNGVFARAPMGCPSGGCLAEIPALGGGAWVTTLLGSGFACGTESPTPATGQGLLQCWGRNSSGTLALGTLGDDEYDVQRGPDSTSFSLLAGGDQFACAQKSGEPQRIFCWGSDTSGQLGRAMPGTTMCNAGGGVGVPVPTLTSTTLIDSECSIEEERFDTLVAAHESACVKTEGGRIFCWGANTESQTGGPASYGSENCIRTEVGQGGWAHLSTFANRHLCAIDEAGQLFCWGDNQCGQLGIGEVTVDPNPDVDIGPTTPFERDANLTFDETRAVVHPDGLRWVHASAGRNHSCAIDELGDVYCWGLNNANQAVPTGFARNTDTPLCQGETHDDGVNDAFVVQLTPRKVTLPEPAVELRASFVASCARMESGDIVCWGQESSRCGGNAGCSNVNTVLDADALP